MTAGEGLTDFRQWVLSVLDLLSADADRQAEYLRTSGVGSDEILLQFDDVLHVARARSENGSLKQEDYLLLKKINDRVISINSGPDSIWTDAGLREAPEWRELRAVAKLTRSELKRSWESE